MAYKKIGVALNQGCDVDGPQLAIKSLQSKGIVFDTVIEADDHIDKPSKVLHSAVVADVANRLKQAVQMALTDGFFPLIVGGDHALSMGSVSANQQANRLVIWIDAHGDSNTHESSLTKRAHGMPIAALMGHGHPDFMTFISPPYLQSHQIFLFGIRALDQAEVEFIQQHKIKMITMEDILVYGETYCLQELLHYAQSFDQVHISFDLDSLDPIESPGVSTPVANGLSHQYALRILESLFNHLNITSMDCVEYNPLLDINDQTFNILDQVLKLVKQAKGG